MLGPATAVESWINPNIPVPQEGDYLRTRKRIWRYHIPDERPAHDRKWALRLLKEYPDISYTMF